MKKSPLEKLLVETLNEPFYLNVVEFENKKGWSPMFHQEYIGSERLVEAIRLRREGAKYLHDNGSDKWKDGKNIKTVKVELFKFR